MARICLERTYTDQHQTLGRLFVYDDAGELLFDCFTLELPWLENKRRESCIPPGSYRAIKHQSPRFGATLWLQDVPGRSEILIHFGNYRRDTLGCILPGASLKDIDGDGHADVTSSKATMRKLLAAVPNNFDFVIHWRESAKPLEK